jgi:hypothetical protein
MNSLVIPRAGKFGITADSVYRPVRVLAVLFIELCGDFD